MKDFLIATFVALIIVNLIESIDKENAVKMPVSISGIKTTSYGVDKQDSVISDFTYTNDSKPQFMTNRIKTGLAKEISSFPIQISN